MLSDLEAGKFSAVIKKFTEHETWQSTESSTVYLFVTYKLQHSVNNKLLIIKNVK